MSSSRTGSRTSPRSSSRRSGGANAQTEIIDLLKADHKRVKEAFRDFERLDLEEDLEQARLIVEQACADLDVCQPDYDRPAAA